MSEINVVPYIDVMLVLLIIFMITAPMLETGVDVDLPQAAAKPVEEQSTPPVIVSILADGQTLLDLGERRSEPVSEDQLVVKVAAVVRQHPETAVLIRGDTAVAYGVVVRVMAALKQAGIPKVGLMTRQEDL